MKIQELCTTCIGLDTLGYIGFSGNSGNMGMATSNPNVWRDMMSRRETEYWLAPIPERNIRRPWIQ